MNEEALNQLPFIEGMMALTQTIEPNLPILSVQTQLNTLVEEAKNTLLIECDPKQRFTKLLALFYGEWGFSGDSEAYFSLENSYLYRVLDRKKGSPVCLGAILLHLAKELDLPISGVNFPTQFMLRADWAKDDVAFLNPFDGEWVTQHVLTAWLKGMKGPFAKLSRDDLAISDYFPLLLRWLTVRKGALLRDEQFVLALSYSMLVLEFKPDDPYEIRDRGLIYQQLECDLAAALDYQYFIDHCPDDPATALLLLQMKKLNTDPLVLH